MLLKQCVVLWIPKPAEFCKMGLGNTTFFEDFVLSCTGAQGLSPGALSGHGLLGSGVLVGSEVLGSLGSLGSQLCSFKHPPPLNTAYSRKKKKKKKELIGR